MRQNLLALLFFTAAAVAQENILPGIEKKLEEAALSSAAFCIAEFEHLGKPYPGAPGESFYSEARIKIIQNIRTGQFETTTCSLSVQAFPPGSSEPSEILPPIGQPFLMIGDVVNGQLRIAKIVEPTSDNVELVKRVLRGRGIDLFEPQADQGAGAQQPPKPMDKTAQTPKTKIGNSRQTAASETKEKLSSATPWFAAVVLIVAGLLCFWLKKRG